MKREVNGFYEECFGTIPINNKLEIKVLTSERISDGSMLVDIRKYSLYGNTFDNIKRPTKKGIKFKMVNIPNVIYGLIDILVSCNMLERNVAQVIKDLVESNVRTD